jgi:hypothetical protein
MKVGYAVSFQMQVHLPNWKKIDHRAEFGIKMRDSWQHFDLSASALARWRRVVKFAPDRIFDPNSYPSGGAGMAGTAHEVLTILEVNRRGGAPILSKER